MTRFVLGVAIATAGVPAFAAPIQDTQSPAAAAADEQTGRPTIAKAAYKRDKGVLVITGTGFDESATIRLNGSELTGEKKFKSDKGKLRVAMPPGSIRLKPEGENRIEIVQNQISSGEFGF